MEMKIQMRYTEDDRIRERTADIDENAELGLLEKALKDKWIRVMILDSGKE